MAFVRAWAEGLDPAQAWARYLGEGAAPDVRRVRSELQRLLDVLRSVARAQGRPDLAALLRRDPEAMAEPGGDRPSLDTFRAQQPEDFYSEAELLELYQATHGAPDARSSARRRQRLRARQVAALQWLETVAVREPHPEDAVAAWLDERLAARLAGAGLLRLSDLARHIAARGYHWYRPIPRVGPAAAARVLHWWREHAATLGSLPSWAGVPPARLDRAALMARPVGRPATRQAGAPAAVGLPAWPVPLERLQVPAALRGHDGRHRAPAAALRIGAADDLQALMAWLRLRTPGSATWRAYRKEAERVLLWALWVAGKPLSSLDGDDVQAYRRFLSAPAAGWMAARGTPRWHDDWRPFEGALSARSAAMALGIVRNLFAWWLDQGYLAVNVWTLVSADRAAPTRADAPGAATAPTSTPDVDAVTAQARHGAADAHRLAPVPGAPLQPGAQGCDVMVPTAATALRALTAAQCKLVQRWIGQTIARRGHTPDLLRLQALWAVARGTGLRPAELVAARLAWLCRCDDGLALQVPGKAWTPADQGASGAVRPSPALAAPRLLRLDGVTTAAVQRYLAARGLSLPGEAAPHHQTPELEESPSGSARPDAPLFSQLRKQSPLSPARLYELMSRALSDCADALAADGTGQDADAAQLRQASTLWLRHGFGLEAALTGVPSGVLRVQMGHRSRASTAPYRRAARPAP